jgi:hypothetical protein
MAQVRRSESGDELHAYRCDVCAAWHLGNSPRSRDADH